MLWSEVSIKTKAIVLKSYQMSPDIVFITFASHLLVNKIIYTYSNYKFAQSIQSIHMHFSLHGLLTFLVFVLSFECIRKVCGYHRHLFSVALSEFLYCLTLYIYCINVDCLSKSINHIQPISCVIYNALGRQECKFSQIYRTLQCNCCTTLCR